MQVLFRTNSNAQERHPNCKQQRHLLVPADIGPQYIPAEYLGAYDYDYNGQDPPCITIYNLVKQIENIN